MSKLKVVRLTHLRPGACAVCNEQGLHMHLDIDLSRPAGWEALVCEDCAKHLKVAAVQLRAWLNVGAEEIANLELVNAIHYKYQKRHWNAKDAKDGKSGRNGKL